ncbi:MAG: hypothetical protein U0R78_09865 [Nocardioidaceae bacterium]
MGKFGNHWQLTNPKAIMFSEDGADSEDPETFQVLQGTKGLFPIYPQTKDLDSWDLQRMNLRRARSSTTCPSCCPPMSVAATACPTHGRRSTGSTPRPRRAGAGGPAALSVGGGAGDPAGPRPTPRRRRATDAAGPHRRGGLLAGFDGRLPFTLTAGQRRGGDPRGQALAREWPMSQLLQGEVGSGEPRRPPARCCTKVVDSGGRGGAVGAHRGAGPAPSSILDLMGDLAQGGLLGGADDGTTVRLLTGSQTTAQRHQALLDIAAGEPGIVVGTHALLQEKVSFADLGLVVVDIEQHRFGVEQRAALTDKAGTPPHVLVMTATPIRARWR